MMKTRLDILEASLEELYQEQQRLLGVESSQEEAESWIDRVESLVDRRTEDTKDLVRHLHEVVAKLIVNVTLLTRTLNARGNNTHVALPQSFRAPELHCYGDPEPLSPTSTISTAHRFLHDNSNDSTMIYSSRVPASASSCTVLRPSDPNFTSFQWDTVLPCGQLESNAERDVVREVCAEAKRVLSQVFISLSMAIRMLQGAPPLHTVGNLASFLYVGGRSFTVVDQRSLEAIAPLPSQAPGGRHPPHQHQRRLLPLLLFIAASATPPAPLLLHVAADPIESSELAFPWDLDALGL
ncbi:hypothetical protein BHM03_00026161 [Ensete ventricosum]|uniref:PH domain-containing protein n=1 Tax=Ensete ventricosum TaxID=4639 RepID=A0A445MH54_ENSVE|nr:hypothetical protein BHM03_00026161 [Ensete ventricosum]